MGEKVVEKPRENREYRDSVFVDLFQTSEFAQEYAKELSRWLMNLGDDWDGKIKAPVYQSRLKGRSTIAYSPIS